MQKTKLEYGLTQETLDRLNKAGFIIVPKSDANKAPNICDRVECLMRGSCACVNAPVQC